MNQTIFMRVEPDRVSKLVTIDRLQVLIALENSIGRVPMRVTGEVLKFLLGRGNGLLVWLLCVDELLQFVFGRTKLLGDKRAGTLLLTVDRFYLATPNERRARERDDRRRSRGSEQHPPNKRR